MEPNESEEWLSLSSSIEEEAPPDWLSYTIFIQNVGQETPKPAPKWKKVLLYDK